MSKYRLLTSLICIMSNFMSFAQLQRTINEPLSSRQVHLDFYTSELIPDTGERFAKKQFPEALKIRNVNQINFDKCHYGYSYYLIEVGAPCVSIKKGQMKHSDFSETRHFDRI